MVWVVLSPAATVSWVGANQQNLACFFSSRESNAWAGPSLFYWLNIWGLLDHHAKWPGSRCASVLESRPSQWGMKWRLASWQILRDAFRFDFQLTIDCWAHTFHGNTDSFLLIILLQLLQWNLPVPNEWHPLCVLVFKSCFTSLLHVASCWKMPRDKRLLHLIPCGLVTINCDLGDSQNICVSLFSGRNGISKMHHGITATEVCCLLNASSALDDHVRWCQTRQLPG